MGKATTDGRVYSLDELPACAGGGLSRRDFCRAAGAGMGLLAIGLPACTLEPPRVQTGGIDTPPFDAGNGTTGTTGTTGSGTTGTTGSGTTGTTGSGTTGTTGKGGAPDMAEAAPDMSKVVANECSSTSGLTACGKGSAVAVNMALQFTDEQGDVFFVCRDSGGLFAMSAACTHEGVTVEQKGSGFYCPRHGATFAFDGTKPTSPARSPLPHFTICFDASETIYVDTGTETSSSTRY